MADLIRGALPRFRRGAGAAALACLLLGAHGSAAQPAPEASQAASAGEGLTEEAAVARALGRAGAGGLAQQARRVAQAEALAASAWPNPSVGWTREHLLGSAGSNEDEVVVSQAFDLSGRRSLRAEAAERRADAAGHDASALARLVGRDVRLAYHDVLAAEATLSAAGEWIVALERALDIVTRREKQGESSAFDRLRLERELRHARATRAEREAVHLAARARLAAWLGIDGTALSPLSGALLDNDPPAASADALLQRPEVRALEARVQAAQLEGEAASRSWVPGVEIAAGYKTAEEGGDRSHGYVVGLLLSLPLFDRSQADAARAAAEQGLLAAERSLLLARETADLKALAAEAGRLHEAATRFQGETAADAGRLVTAAEAGWKGGAVTVLELLDAYRNAAFDATRATELAHAARRARVMLDAAVGRGAP